MVYVDDIIVISDSEDGINKLKQHLNHFQTKDLGCLIFFLVLK